jgi:hypothetical protein
LKPALQVGAQAIFASVVFPLQLVADALVSAHGWQSVPQVVFVLQVASQPFEPSPSVLTKPGWQESLQAAAAA